MGACGSDLYSLVKKEHGEQFHKFILGEQVKREFSRIIGQKLTNYDSTLETRRASLHQNVKQKEQSMKSTFTSLRSTLDDELPGGVESLEQMRKQSLSSILGLEEYQKRFQGVHEQIDRQLNHQKQQTHKQMQQLLHQVSDNCKVDPEKMRLYHQTSQQKRAMIYERGVKEYQSGITEKLKGIERQYEEALQLKPHFERLQGVISLEHVDHLLNVAQNKFKSEALALVGGGFDSNIRI